MVILDCRGEDYDFESDEVAGFIRVDAETPLVSFLGNDILGENSNFRGEGGVYDSDGGTHSDKITYELQFAHAGIYYPYMHFTLFDRGNRPEHYQNEDSFYLPPWFDGDPQNDWPSGNDRGGYVSGCCEDPTGEFLFFKDENGNLVDRRWGPSADNPVPFFEGNFHWNELRTSPSLPEGEGNQPFAYEVTEADVGQTLTFTVSSREQGIVIDAWVFSTSATLMDDYSQTELDALFGTPSAPAVGPECDLNGDFSVDAADAGIMFGAWGDAPEVGHPADKNDDGVIDAADAGVLFAQWTGEAPSPGAGDATAAYNPGTGLIEISADGVVNVFVESASGALTTGAADAAPAGLLVSDNASRVGLTGFGGINVTNWKSQNTPGLAKEDLSLVVGPALGVPSVSHAADTANFEYVPEPATSSLLVLGLLGWAAASRREHRV